MLGIKTISLSISISISTILLIIVTLGLTILFAQTFTNTAQIDCFTGGCQAAVVNGDTQVFGMWAATGNFIYNGATKAGQVLGTLNDGEVTPCATSSNIAVVSLSGIDYATPSNASQTRVNCMTDYGQGTAMLWPPAFDGTCSTGGESNCSWKSYGNTQVNGNSYIAIYRQAQGSPPLGHDSTIIISSDNGATWLNPATIGDTPSATGGLPDPPGSAGYPTSMLWPDQSPFDGVSARMARVEFFHYCQDESIGCPSIDNNTTYTYGIGVAGNFANGILWRWPKTSMPTLDISTMEWYVCPGYPVTICDGSDNGNWTGTLASATNLTGVCLSDVRYFATQGIYVGVCWLGDGTYLVSTSPHAWGPWTINDSFTPNCSGNACSVFTSIPGPSSVSLTSTTADFTIGSTSSNIHDASGTLFWNRFTLTVTGGGGLRGVVRIKGTAAIK